MGFRVVFALYFLIISVSEFNFEFNEVLSQIISLFLQLIDLK
jgi:hypothetical protein